MGKQKKKSRKTGIEKGLNVSAAITSAAPASKRKPEQLTDAADKQGLERGKAAAGEALGQAASFAKNALHSQIYPSAPDDFPTSGHKVDPAISRSYPRGEKAGAAPDPKTTDQVTASHRPSHDSAVSPPSSPSVPSNRDDGQLRAREIIHKDTAARSREEHTRFSEPSTPSQEKAPRSLPTAEEESLPSRNTEPRQKVDLQQEGAQTRSAPKIITEDEKEIPALPRRQNTSGESGNPVPERITVPSRENQRDSAFPYRGSGQREVLPQNDQERERSGREGSGSSPQSKDHEGLRTRSTEHSVRSREEGSPTHYQETRGVKTSGQEERFAQYFRQAADTVSAAEKAQEGAQAVGEAAKAAGETAGGASTAGVSTLIKESVKKAEEFFHAVSGNEKSPTSNDHSAVGSLFGFLAAGAGAIFTLLGGILIPLLIAAVVISGFSFGGNKDLSDDVISWMPQINSACVKYGIPEYAPLAAAIMMQESRGDAELVHGDLMECAEGMGLPVGTPIEPEESIDFGVKLIASLLEQAQVISPADMDHLKLAVQAYNYGSGYISYALAKDGKYTKENALAFAQKQAEMLGWGSYGDPEYVDHVFRFYTVSAGTGIGGFSSRYPSLCYPMEGYPWTTYSGHEGIDLPCELGTPVYASASGTVSYVKSNWTEADGKAGMMSYGNCVCISHGDGLETRYAHLSLCLVASGQQVFQGQIIGYSGNTGNSTGPHMHYAVYVNGSPGGCGYSNNAALAFPEHRQP